MSNNNNMNNNNMNNNYINNNMNNNNTNNINNNKCYGQVGVSWLRKFKTDWHIK